jgi:hypothetical protein
MNITNELLRSWSACVDGYSYFRKNWPDGSTYATVRAKLREDQKGDWCAWLTHRVWSTTIADPASIAALAQLEVDEALATTKDSPNSASGDHSTAASSGDHSKAASSGYYSKAASSGNYSKAASSGENTIAMVAGLNGAAKAGENGCFALCWHDGERNRIVTGYVGENGILADTWYHVVKGKLEVKP